MDETIKYITNNIPFRDEIIKWIKINPEVLIALKFMTVNRFVHFSGINIIEPNEYRTDQILGIVVYDITNKILKQDFIVDINNNHSKFIYYTSLPKDMSHIYGSNVKHINEFQILYGNNGDFHKTHHPDIKSLHPELQSRINNYLKLTKRELKN